MDKEKFEKFQHILQAGWGLQLYDYSNVRAAYKVQTSNGIMSLKRTREKLERLSFIKHAQNYLQQNGFCNMSPLLLTLEGEPFYRENKNTYILTPWIDGIEPSYKSVSHIQMIAFNLADMHNKSVGFKTSNTKVKAKYDKWTKKIAKREREFKLYKDLASTGNEKFDQIFLQHADWLITRTQIAAAALNGNAYKHLVKDSRVGYLCHGDTAVRNCVIKDNEIIFIDFDSMSQDLPVIDLWRLLRRALRRNKWSPDFVNAVIVAYEQNRKLTKEEKEVLLALLTFPERAWRIAHRYYEKKNRSDWSAEGYCKDLVNFIADRDNMDIFTLG